MKNQKCFILILLTLLISIFLNIYQYQEKNKQVNRLDAEFKYYVSKIYRVLNSEENDKFRSLLGLEYSSKLFAISEKTSLYSKEPLIGSYSSLLVEFFVNWNSGSLQITEDTINNLKNTIKELSVEPDNYREINKLYSILLGTSQ